LFFLYSTVGCHLCDDALIVLHSLQTLLKRQGVEWGFDVLDISDDARLFKRYGVRIPVLHFSGSDVDLGWPFDLPSAQRYVLSQIA